MAFTFASSARLFGQGLIFDFSFCVVVVVIESDVNNESDSGKIGTDTEGLKKC
jgi:hypothetical protein